MKRRGIDEQVGREAVASILTASPAANHVITCGDFNTRCANKAPTIRDSTVTRQGVDTRVCARASWFIQLLELTEQHILNGNEF